jgi:hypothetical protein
MSEGGKVFQLDLSQKSIDIIIRTMRKPWSNIAYSTSYQLGVMTVARYSIDR